MVRRWKPLEPDLEIVQIVQGTSFTAWAHGLPFRTVRWHFHPEYEIHLVTHTTGQYFVGDFIGEFEPGQLVLTGPNLPHHWMSDGPVDQIVAERGIVVQFTEEFIRGTMSALLELRPLQPVLEASRWGVLFPEAVSSAAQPLLRELINANGPRRVALFMQIMDLFATSPEIDTLAGRDYVPNPTWYLSSAMNSVLTHIAAHPTAQGSEADLAAIAGKSRSAFSRAFKAHTGLSLVDFINRLRINFACQLLMTEPDRTVADICFEAGFNNLSNFNRRFLATKGMSPTQFATAILAAPAGGNANAAAVVAPGCTMSAFDPLTLTAPSSSPPDLDHGGAKLLVVTSQDPQAHPPLPDKRSSTPPEEPTALKRFAGSMTFGPFRLVPSRQLLLEGDRPVRLGSRAYELLLALVEHEGELLAKEDLIRRVWPDTFVEEANLRVHIAALRKALGDGNAGNRYLSNIPGRGYRFVAAVRYTPEVPEATAAPESEASNLPAPLTRMLGRAEAIETLGASLGRYQVVSVVGPGGIGKTTVAIVLAGSEARRFTDGACFVDLGSLPSPDLVPAAIGTALGLAISAADPTPAILAHLRYRRMLLVLDGCETFPDRAAAVVEQIAASTAASVLVTSREPLRAEGEHVYRLPPLDLPQATLKPTAAQALQFSAIQLFVERAGAASDGFRLTDHDTPAAIEICRRLDGIPLAIELAAGRVDAFGVGGLAALLDDRFRLMIRGRRTALPRHQTLAAALDWSYNALSEAERRVLRRLGTFSGSFDLDAAAAVASDEQVAREQVIDTLADLVSKSLITADVSASIAMYRLGETTRSYVRLKLSEAGELNRMTACHGAYLRDAFDFAEQEWNYPVASRLALHRSRLDDVRAALDWAFSPGGDVFIGIDLTASVIPLWMHLSLMDECQQRTERAIAALSGLAGVRPRREMKLYGALGLALMFTRGAVKRTVEALTRSHDIAANLGEVEYSMRALWGLWVDRLNNGAVEDSLALAGRFIEIAEESRRQVEAAIGERMLGFSLHFLGRQVEAQTRLERMLSFDPGDERSSHPRRFQFDQWCTARATYSEVLWLRGFADRAMAQAISSVAEAEEIGHVLTLCNTLAKSCAVALLAGDCRTSAAMVGRLRERAHVHSLPFWQVEAECLGAVLALKSGNLSGGIELMRHHLRRFPGSTLTVRYVAYLGKFADALSRSDEFDEAEAAMSEAFSRTKAAAGRWWMPELLRVQGEVMLRRDCASASRADGCFRQAMALAAEQGALGWELRIAMSVMRHASALRCEDEAREQLAAVYGRLTEGLDTQDVKEAAALLGQ